MEDNIKINVKETGWEGVDCMHVGENRGSQGALVNTILNLLII
jgi:hypothetical protein